MGQNNSSSGSEKRSSKRFSSIPSGDFNPSTETGGSSTRRATVSGAPAARRHSSAGGHSSSTTSHRRTASSLVSSNVQAARRANNIASPPPYSATSTNSRIPQTIPEAPPRVNNISSPGQENALELLKTYDTVFLIDDSGSMAGSLWREAGKALAGVARVAAQYDDDGIDIYFLNSRESLQGVTSEDEVRALFNRVQPRGSTPTGARLDVLARSYLSALESVPQDFDNPNAEIKPINYIVITDGAPSDDPESVIVAIARRLDRGNFPLSQLGIQFVQIGSDPEATKALEELDDDLAGRHGIRDIVDTTPYKSSELDGETLIKILLGGINRRVDKRGGASVLR